MSPIRDRPQIGVVPGAVPLYAMGHPANSMSGQYRMCPYVHGVFGYPFC
jgi:hypothetical protein